MVEFAHIVGDEHGAVGEACDGIGGDDEGIDYFIYVHEAVFIYPVAEDGLFVVFAGIVYH